MQTLEEIRGLPETHQLAKDVKRRLLDEFNRTVAKKAIHSPSLSLTVAGKHYEMTKLTGMKDPKKCRLSIIDDMLGNFFQNEAKYLRG